MSGDAARTSACATNYGLGTSQGEFFEDVEEALYALFAKLSFERLIDRVALRRHFLNQRDRFGRSLENQASSIPLIPLARH